MKMVLPYNQDARLLLPPSKVQCEIGSHEKNKINASKSFFFFSFTKIYYAVVTSATFFHHNGMLEKNNQTSVTSPVSDH